ncbi:MAG TPA: peptide ABC transporter substrate-binding protein [Dongiaceae bacterium]|nr:peptide ABC transporter substrate-binding protein [Dongiaceae bacterium]
MSLMKRYAFWSALAGAALLVASTAAQAEMVLHRGNGAEPETLDPAKSTGVPESNIQYELLEGLTTYSVDGLVIPGVAEKWDVSDDSKTYTFHLRDSKWSNGDPVTADDFVYSWRRVVDPATASDYAPIFNVITNAEEINKGEEKDLTKLGVEAVDPKTLKVSLKESTPYFLSMLRHSSFLPVNKADVEKYGQDWTKPGNFIGNGAFTLSEWTPQSSLTVVKNPNYYDAANVKLDKIVFYPTEDIAEEFKRFRNGELDITYEVPSDQVKMIESTMKDEYEAKPYLGTYYYVINLTREPLGKQKGLREALSLAIDRETLADKVLNGSFLPGYSWVPPGIPDYPNHYLDFKDMKQADRLAKAKELMEKAGYGPDKPLKLEILYNTSENHKKIAIAIQNMWKKIGVDATLNNQEWQVYLDTRDNKQFDVARAAWIADYVDPVTFLDLFLSDAGVRNDAGYNNPKYDELVKDSFNATDPKQRLETLAKAEEIFLDDLPLIPILYYKTRHMVSKRVAGWEYNSLDFHMGRYMAVN